MMRRYLFANTVARCAFLVLLFATVSGLFTSAALAQAPELEKLQQKRDSLETVRDALQEQLNVVHAVLAETEALVQLHQSADVVAESVVLITNMEASLRSRPSPDGRVVRLLPASTPLIAIDYDGAYWKVRYEGVEGWVMRLFIDEGEGASALKDKLTAMHQVSDGATASEDLQLAAERAGKDFLVTDFGINPPNSAGGISLYYAFEHLDSTRAVREVTFSITPYDEDGLKARGLNSGTSTKRLRRFGPISVHDGKKEYQFDNVWYNGNIACAEINRIDIVYTDGSRASHRQEVGHVLSGKIKNNCTLTTAESLEAGHE
ncbi:MAG: SH3 domain-containing protein [Bacteroidota bacterium]